MWGRIFRKDRLIPDARYRIPVAGWSDYYKYKVGLLYNEWKQWYDAGTPSYHNYNPKKWAGIDCSGLVQRCAFEGGYRFEGVSYEGNIGSGEADKLGGEIDSQTFSRYFSQEVTNSFFFIHDLDDIKIGDIVIYPPDHKHVGIVSEINLVYGEDWEPTPASKVKIISALADPDKGYRVSETEIRETAPAGHPFKIWRWPQTE